MQQKEVDENLLPSNLKSKSKLSIPSRGSLLTLQSRPSVFANEDGALPIGEFEPISIISEGKNPPTTLLSKAKVLGTLMLYFCSYRFSIDHNPSNFSNGSYFQYLFEQSLVLGA